MLLEEDCEANCAYQCSDEVVLITLYRTGKCLPELERPLLLLLS